MIIVLNATPLISLAAIGRLALLQELFGEVYIPQAVYTEIKAKRAFGHDEIEADWIQVKPVQGENYLGLLLNDLDRGEAEAILLAKEMRADALVIDERMGYQIARSQGLMVIGTLTHPFTHISNLL
jgi:predicted nucleic acid-binding protein